MNKRVCDICGNDIINHNYDEFKIKRKEYTNDGLCLGYKKIDVCNDCSKRLRQLIASDRDCQALDYDKIFDTMKERYKDIDDQSTFLEGVDVTLKTLSLKYCKIGRQ